MPKITKPCANCGHAAVHSEVAGGCVSPISQPNETTRWCPCTTYLEPSRPIPQPRVVRARTGDPETSHAATAALTEDTLRASQAAVLRFIRTNGPMTDVALVEDYPQHSEGYPRQSPSGLRSRRAELVTGGLVEDTQKRERLESGRQAVVWGAKS